LRKLLLNLVNFCRRLLENNNMTARLPPRHIRNPKFDGTRIEILRKKLDNEDYMQEAIGRMAQILCNELLDLPRGVGADGQRKK
jgi:hypothetical protein